MVYDLHMSREDPQMKIRLPADLKDQIETAAKEAGRSMNAEIIERLSRTQHDEETVKILRNNTVLLRTLANFVLLQNKAPEAMEPMQEAIVSMSQAIKNTEDDTQLLSASKKSFLEYIELLTEQVNKITDLLGPGWGSKTKK